MQKPEPPTVTAPLATYEQQAEVLLAAHQSGAGWAIQLFNQCLPRFLDDQVKWLPRPLPADEIRAARLTEEDARLAVARRYSFRDWEALAGLVSEMARENSPVRAFELAAEAVISGDEASLRQALTADTGLTTARSTRVTCHDPPVHAATLLHYIAANGVEGYRQKSPANAVAMARLLLESGAEVDALAGMYGGQYATLGMLVSSSPPAHAGVQVPLTHLLIDHGAAIDGAGSPAWHSPVLTALRFGFVDCAEALAARGARTDDLAILAGLGRLEDFTNHLPAASPDSRRRALALAAQLGHSAIVRALLEAGEDPGRFNPPDYHSHATPLHHAALHGHLETVRLLIAHGARLDIEDRLWHSTPLSWAEHNSQTEVAAFLAQQGNA